MKVYSIGREEGCDIIIDDNSDVISRRHAALNVSSSGKMTIVDYSHNGTYVNGIKISPNVPVPVTRKDNISFSHVARLDWNQIPDTRGKIIRYSIIGILAVLLIIAGVFGFNSFLGGKEDPAPQPEPVMVDSTEIKVEKKRTEEREKQIQDSIKKQVKDSLEKVKSKADGQKVKKSSNTKKESAKKGQPKTDEPKQEESKKRFR